MLGEGDLCSAAQVSHMLRHDPNNHVHKQHAAAKGRAPLCSVQVLHLRRHSADHAVHLLRHAAAPAREAAPAAHAVAVALARARARGAAPPAAAHHDAGARAAAVPPAAERGAGLSAVKCSRAHPLLVDRATLGNEYCLQSAGSLSASAQPGFDVRVSCATFEHQSSIWQLKLPS